MSLKKVRISQKVLKSGMAKFEWLKHSNVPLEYIGNKNRRDLFENPQTPVVSPHESSPLRAGRQSVGRRILANLPSWIE